MTHASATAKLTSAAKRRPVHAAPRNAAAADRLKK